jgi:hypothetical protein
MATKQSVQGGWSGIAKGVRKSRVPLVETNETRKGKYSTKILKEKKLQKRRNQIRVEDKKKENL